MSEKEALAWWAHKEGGASVAIGASSSGAATPSAIRDIKNKADVAGKAIRRAHMFEGKVQEAEVKCQALEVKHRDAIEEERAIATGLRDRIGRLEGRLRTADQAKTDAIDALDKERRERGEEASVWKGKEKRWKSEKEDLISLRDDLRGKLETSGRRERALQEEKQALLEEGRKMRLQLELFNGDKL